MSEHERCFLTTLLHTYENCLVEISLIEAEIMRCADKFNGAVVMLTTVPGIQQMTAISIISEIGIDLRMFPTAAQFCSLAGMCPGNNESAGKKKSTHLSRGNVHLKSVICQCAWAAARSKKNFLHEWFWRLARRRGTKKAVIALGRKLLTIIYYMFMTGEVYDEGRYDLSKQRQENLRKSRLIIEAKRLGLTVVAS